MKRLLQFYLILSMIVFIGCRGGTFSKTDGGDDQSPATPAIPTGLIELSGNTQVTLSWVPSINATNYHIKRAETTGGTYIEVGMTTTTTYADLDLINDKSYYYVVSASNANGESGNSGEVSATPSFSHVSIDAEGWTVITPSDDTQIIYVSISGNDSFDGLSPEFTNGSHGPKNTVSAGLALMRNHMPDWLLLKRGDIFDEALSIGSLSGKSSSEPMVFSSYGNSIDQPILKSPIYLNGGGSHVSVIHLCVDQPVVYPADNAGIYLVGNDFLIEGCRFNGGSQPVGIDTPSANIRLRRNVFYKNINNIFVTGVNTFLFEENVLFPTSIKNGGSDMHAMYITRTGNSNITVQDNLFLQDPTLNLGDGIKVRSGGIVRGNVIVGAAWSAILMGGKNDDGSSNSCGSNGPGIIDGNLVIDTLGNNAALTYQTEYLQSPVKVINNIFLRVTQGPNLGGNDSQYIGNISIGGIVNLGSGSNILWKDNVFYGTPDPAIGPLMQVQGLNNNGCLNFKAINNRYYFPGWAGHDFGIYGAQSFEDWQGYTGETGSDSPMTFVDYTRSLGSYNASLGGTSTTQAFFEAAAAQSKYRYDKRYTASAAIAYIREGLAISSP